MKILFSFCLPDCGSLLETGSYQLQPPERRRLAVIMLLVVNSKQSANTNEMPALLSQSCGRRPVLAPELFPVFEFVTSATAFALTQPSTQLRLVLLVSFCCWALAMAFHSSSRLRIHLNSSSSASSLRLSRFCFKTMSSCRRSLFSCFASSVCGRNCN